MIAAEDERAIRELYARAIHLFDKGDVAWVDYWADEPEFVFPGDEASGFPGMTVNTREGLVGMVGQAFAMMQGRGLHHFTNFTFDAIDGGVQVRAYLMLVVNGETLAEPSTIRQNTRIDDLIVKVGDRWLFKRRSVGATW
jgi:SnoaL-like domain